MIDAVPGSSAVKQNKTMRHATDPPNGFTAVKEIAAQEFDEGTDGTMEQSYDLAAVVEDTTPGVGQQSIVHGMRNQHHSNKKNHKRRDRTMANQAKTR